MYRYECILDGKLMYKSTPDGIWREDTSVRGMAVKALLALDVQTREEVCKFVRNK